MMQPTSQDLAKAKVFFENFLPLKHQAEASKEGTPIERYLNETPEEKAMRAKVNNLSAKELLMLVACYYTLRRNVDQTSTIPAGLESWDQAALASKITGTQARLLRQILSNS